MIGYKEIQEELALKKVIKSLRKIIRVQEKDLKKYGRHDDECPAGWEVIVGDKNRCGCGFDEALRGSRGKGK